MTVQPRLKVSPSRPKATSKSSMMVVRKVTPCSGQKPSEDEEKKSELSGQEMFQLYLFLILTALFGLSYCCKDMILFGKLFGPFQNFKCYIKMINTAVLFLFSLYDEHKWTDKNIKNISRGLGSNKPASGPSWNPVGEKII